MPRQVPEPKENEPVAESIVWKEPGPSLRTRGPAGSGKWMEKLQPLVSHPNRWALIHTAEVPEGQKGTPSQRASGVAGQLRSGKARIPDGKWEFTSRQNEVYAQYLGPE